MKYFTIDESIDLDIIGEYPQVSTTENCVLGSPFSDKKLSFGEIPNKIPYLELEFNKRAKKTTLDFGNLHTLRDSVAFALAFFYINYGHI